MRGFNRLAILPVLLCCCIVTVKAFDWPVATSLLRHGFGTYRQGFMKGIEFSAAADAVLPVAPGELIFHAQGRQLAGGYPIVGGSLLVLAHAAAMTSVYTGLSAGAAGSVALFFDRSAALGFVRSGVDGRNPVFYLYDVKEMRYINPILVLPAIADERPPLFNSVTLRSAEGDVRLEALTTIRQGVHELIVDVVDPGIVGAAMMPLVLRLSINGVERLAWRQDGAWADAGRTRLFTGSGVLAASYHLDDGRIRLGSHTFNRGRSSINLTAIDQAGNRRDAAFALVVQ